MFATTIRFNFPHQGEDNVSLDHRKPAVIGPLRCRRQQVYQMEVKLTACQQLDLYTEAEGLTQVYPQ